MFYLYMNAERVIIAEAPSQQETIGYELCKVFDYPPDAEAVRKSIKDSNKGLA